MKLKNVEELQEILAADGVILCPTDTIWGLSCDAASSVAVERIFEIKKRPKEKSVIVLMASEEMLAEYGVVLTEKQKRFLSETMRPTTIILDGVKGLAPEVYHADGSLGVRIVKPWENNPGSQWCHEFLIGYGKPIVSTSANMSGEVSPAVLGQIDQHITEAVDGFPLFEEVDAPHEPSMIVRVYADGKVDVLRA